MTVTPKLAVPLRLDGSAFAVVEQDSPAEVAACVYALLATERGARYELPDYGVEDKLFDPVPVELDEWLEQIGTWEPRADVETTQDVERWRDVIRVNVGV